jgi:hypothetical protein
VRASQVQHTVRKLSSRATILLQTSSQSEVWARSYDLTKSRKSKLGQFRDSSLGISGQKAIWMWVLWRGTKYTIWGKVVASFEFGLWWVKWVQSCPWTCPSTMGAVEYELTNTTRIFFFCNLFYATKKSHMQLFWSCMQHVQLHATFFSCKGQFFYYCNLLVCLMHVRVSE